MTALWINNRTIDDLVLQVVALDGHLSPAIPQRVPVSLASAGALFGTELKVSTRSVTVSLDVRPDTFAGRQATMDAFKYRIRGLLELRTGDLPGRLLRCVLDSVSVVLFTGAHANPVVGVDLVFLCVDPARIDVEPLVYGLSTSRTACPVGTDPVAPLLYLFGASTPVVNPVVILRDHTGAETHRMTFAVSLGSSDVLVIDSGVQSIVRTTAGVVQTGAAAGLSVFASGRFPVLAPDDASPELSLWPTVELAATSGTPTGLLSYQRRW